MADATQTNDPQVQPAEETTLLTITPLAVEKVRALMAERELEDYALRVFVQGGGCSGFQYGMAFEDRFFETDKIVEVEGIKVVIDPASMQYMAGAEIDYVDSLMGAGFSIQNPNAVSSCGCGNAEDDEVPGNAAGGCSSCG